LVALVSLVDLLDVEFGEFLVIVIVDDQVAWIRFPLHRNFTILAEGIGVVQHDGIEIKRRPEMILTRTKLCKLILATFVDILKVYVQKLVSVGPHVLVVEAESMHDLVECDPGVLAALSEGQMLLAAIRPIYDQHLRDNFMVTIY